MLCLFVDFSITDRPGNILAFQTIIWTNVAIAAAGDF